MSEKKVPADGKWRMALWPGDPLHLAELTAVIAAPPHLDRWCMECEEKKGTVLAIDHLGTDAYPRCEDCRPVVAKEEGA